MTDHTDHTTKIVDFAEAIGFLRALDPARAVKLYSGRPGCACGCNGTYTHLKDDKTYKAEVTEAQAISKARRKIKHMVKRAEAALKSITSNDRENWSVQYDLGAYYSPSAADGPIPEGHVWLEIDGRVNAIYFAHAS